MQQTRISGDIVKSVLIRFLLIGIPLGIILYSGLFFLYKNRINSLIEDVEKKQEESSILDEFYIQSLFSNSYNDLNVIANSDEFSGFNAHRNSGNRTALEEMFVRFIKSKPSLYQIRYLDRDGMEIVRAEKKDGKILVTPLEQLQDKGKRYYVEDLQSLKKKELYISDFDLNMENGELIYPLQPTIRFALSVSKGENVSGYLIINIDGWDIINRIHAYEENKSQEIHIGILDRTHLISTQFMDKKEDISQSFTDLPQDIETIYEAVNSDRDRGRFSWKNDNYFYNIIDQQNENFSSRFNSKGGPWIILSSYNPQKLINERGGFYVNNSFIKEIITFIFLVLIFIILIFFRNQEAEHLLLTATNIITDLSHDGIIITDRHKKVIYCNPLFENLFGFKLKDIQGKDPKDFLKGQPRIKIEKSKSSDIIWEGNVWDVTADNIHIQRYLRLRTVSSTDSRIMYYLGVYSEPHVRDNPTIDEKEFFPDSHLDRSSLNYLSPLLQPQGKNIPANTLVIVIRITEYTLLRNKLTDQEDNTLISRITDLLKKNLNISTIFFAPSSGYLLISTSISEDHNVERVMDKIDRSISSIRFSDKDLTIRYLSGAATAPDHGTSATELITNAYIALEAINRIKTVKYLLYNQDIYKTVNNHFKIKRELETAFLQDEFTVVYQLQNNSQTLKTTGIEALVRWNSNKLGQVPPYLFVPIMEEEITQIKRLGKHMLKKVLKECECLIPFMPEDFRISINLSSQEFADFALMTDLVNIIRKSSFPDNHLCFEITETIMSENLVQTNMMIDMLHKNGILVAIDDFGTGYSSLGYLKDLKSDKLKVDRIFVKDYPELDDGSILKAIAGLAQELDIKVVVEGVETEEQLKLVQKLNCQDIQGYYIAKPMPISNLLEKLKEEKS